MKCLIDLLKCYNAKERFYLIGQVLGNSEFSLSTEFVSILEDTLKLHVNTNNIFVALDYHLDWV